MESPKDVKWLKLDCNALDDPKIMALVAALGLEGYGIYIMLIQYLAMQEPNYDLSCDMLKHLAYRNHVSEEKVKAVVGSFHLFEIENNFFYSLSLIRRMEPYDNLKNINRDKANKRWNKYRELEKENAAALPEHYRGNADKNRIDKNRIDKNIEEKKKELKAESKKVDSDSSSIILNSNIKKEEAEKLYNEIICFFTEDLKPKTVSQKTKWVDVLEKLLRIDKQDPEKIKRVIESTREDDFWKGNFLSVLKLRRKDKDDNMYFTVFCQRMSLSKSGNGRKISKVNALWGNDENKVSQKISKDPYKRFNPDTIKLLKYFKNGIIRGTKNSVFSIDSIPVTQEQDIEWLKIIEEILKEGYSHKELQEVVIYARKHDFWKERLTDLSLLLKKDNYSKLYIGVILDEMGNIKHNIPVTEAERKRQINEIKKL